MMDFNDGRTSQKWSLYTFYVVFTDVDFLCHKLNSIFHQMFLVNSIYLCIGNTFSWNFGPNPLIWLIFLNSWMIYLKRRVEWSI